MVEKGMCGPQRLTLASLERAVEIVASAFLDDPLMRYREPRRDQRHNAALSVYRPVVRLGILAGGAYGEGQPLAGIAIWHAPGTAAVWRRATWRAGFVRTLCGSGAVPFLRAVGPILRGEALRRRHAPSPHYRLAILAVHPSRQGEGLAAALLTPLLAQADGATLPIYVETMSERNVSLYERFGFQIAERCVLPGSGLKMWALVRDPQPAKRASLL